MTGAQRDPLILPEWQALHREASLVGQLLGSGATSLGRASYGSGFGDYYTAFFGLSIGLERLAKLILVADHAIENGGALPDQNKVRKFGHDLRRLQGKVEAIRSKHSITVEEDVTKDNLCSSIVACLDSFAAASKGRYANFEVIGNPGFDPQNEPVNKWWLEVVEPILDKHYRGKHAEAKARSRAKLVASTFGDVATVRFTDENGNQLNDLEAASERSSQNAIAQKYGRFHTLRVVRWFAIILDQLLAKGTADGIDSLFGHSSFLESYRVDDSFLRDRKNWPLGRR